MKDSCVLMGCFMLGILGGLYNLVPKEYLTSGLEMGTLYALIFLVGMGMGSDGKFLHNILHMGKQELLVPMAVVVGSLAGGALVSLMLADIDIIAGAAVGAGFGYYSLSSVLISQLKGDELGTIALVANIAREVTTILAAPIMVRLAGPWGPIASGGGHHHGHHPAHHCQILGQGLRHDLGNQRNRFDLPGTGPCSVHSGPSSPLLKHPGAKGHLTSWHMPRQSTLNSSAYNAATQEDTT
jgi:hypothetical protein